jgi:cytochrome b pre-mRNA-processing protein 3
MARFNKAEHPNMSWFKRKAKADPVAGLHAQMVAAALAPELYRHGGVEDSFEGRFESLTLHAFMTMRRLNALPPPAPEMAQELVDRTFTGIEHTLRQIGISDVAVPKKMKALAGSFLGRIEAYDAAMAAGDPAALRAALSRNVLSGGDASLLGDYVETATTHLGTLSLESLLGDAVIFPGFVLDQDLPLSGSAS